MAVEIPEVEDTEMNMTPMIDIVFQLIVFFLLTLKFKSVDQRIETELPKDRGIAMTEQFVEELPMITVKLFRVNREDPANAFTRIRVGQNYTFELPKGEWNSLEGEQEEAMELAYENVFANVTNAIKTLWAAQGENAEIKGEIKTPRPSGESVPHGDVIKVLDSFMQAGLDDVKFEGAPPPNPGATGG